MDEWISGWGGGAICWWLAIRLRVLATDSVPPPPPPPTCSPPDPAILHYLVICDQPPCS